MLTMSVARKGGSGGLWVREILLWLTSALTEPEGELYAHIPSE